MAQVLCPVVIGRDAELQALDAALAAATAGHGQCAVIAGEPGIGKSRLAREIASRAADRGIAVVTGRAVPQSATAPYRQRCHELLRSRRPNPWAAAGITSREADVLRLVADGLANKQIAARLRLSPRTVEKHVESLLRKTGTRSRTELAVAASPAAARQELPAT